MNKIHVCLAGEASVIMVWRIEHDETVPGYNSRWAELYGPWSWTWFVSSLKEVDANIVMGPGITEVRCMRCTGTRDLASPRPRRERIGCGPGKT